MTRRIINILLLASCMICGQVFAMTGDSSAAKDLSISLVVEDADSVSCTIPFTRAGNLILVRAKADTIEGNFILDTGCPNMVLNITYFRNYNSFQVSNEEQAGITGAVTSVTRTTIDAFSFGMLSYSKMEADLVNLGHLENSKGVKIFGLMGLQLFKQCEMIIDYESNLIYVHRIDKKESNTYRHAMLNDTSAYTTIPFEIWHGKILTRTEVAGKKLKLIIDSGAESNVLDSRLSNKVFENVSIVRRVMLNGIGSQKVEALFGNLNNMKIGNQNTGTLPVLITNLEKTCLSDGSCVDGILGFDFLSLHKIGFNFVNNKMYIWK